VVRGKADLWCLQVCVAVEIVVIMVLIVLITS
jgi:hypothetical protein